MCSSEDIFFVDQRPSALVKDYTLEGSAFQLSSGDITYDSVKSVVWSFDNKRELHTPTPSWLLLLKLNTTEIMLTDKCHVGKISIFGDLSADNVWRPNSDTALFIVRIWAP